ncbi:MAG: CheR family methyltransferase [Sulfurospirillum sp.]
MDNSIFVGIGASAGGLKALEKLVEKLPIALNNVYIIALHLDPSKKSSLAQILARCSTLPVVQIDSQTIFLPNHIYIIPPGSNLVFRNNHLVLEAISGEDFVSSPNVDILFESLARYKKSKSMGIVLTGSGKDGSTGIKSIKDSGGYTIAQDPKEAYHSNMPQNAIDTGCIYKVLSIEQIAKYLSSSLFINKRLLNEKITPKILRTIKKILKDQEGLNIAKYKDDTIMRRINKRILLVGNKTQEEYAEYIKNNPQEAHLLYQDILIGVTAFFRDKSSFKALEKELGSYLKDKPQDYELRVWSIACSSGEEAYSIAILIAQISKKMKKNFNVHIFATDIDDEALDIARSAHYSKNALEGMDEELIYQYFIETQNGYRVVQSIREQIVFTHHNLLSEPPFIKQDIISCRNLLIYIKPETQQETFTLFHYALKDHGILFLGSSESTLLSVRYFLALDLEHKIYKKEKMKNPPKLSSHYFSKHLEQGYKSKPAVIDKIQTVDIEEQISKKIFNFFCTGVSIDR